MKLATIGYERETQGAVIQRLKDAGVEVLIDVRAVASSRRAGFSKTLLAASLNEQGIGYVHLRELGTPKPGRDAARKGRIAKMHEIFEAHMAEPAAQLELAKATEIARGGKAALLCYEADAAGCHRTILANRIREALGCEIENL
ncbi:MAG TPA: DUF488 domain-containing protein [Phenylobacterium sp.]|jgi:uncharacterized protein (DUF488 family)